jgi:hypothetical protein
VIYLWGGLVMAFIFRNSFAIPFMDYVYKSTGRKSIKFGGRGVVFAYKVVI